MNRLALLVVVAVPTIALAAPRKRPKLGLLAMNAKVYQSAADAKAEPPLKHTFYNTRSVTILEEDGHVVRVRTGYTSDCIDPLLEHYEIVGWVARSSLIPRLTTPLRKTFKNETAYVIDVGAPVIDGEFSELGISVPDTKTALAVTVTRSSLLPAARRKHVSCADGEPTVSDDPFSVCVANGFHRDVGDGHAKLIESTPGDAHLGPKIDAMRDGYLVDYDMTCASARVITESLTKDLRVYRADKPAGPQPGDGRHYEMQPGPLVWEDGTPAGRADWNTSYRLDEVTEDGDLRCVSVPRVVGKVCFRAQDTDFLD